MDNDYRIPLLEDYLTSLEQYLLILDRDGVIDLSKTDFAHLVEEDQECLQ